MTRRLLNLLTALSLLICATFVAMWVRSYLATDTLRIEGPPGSARVVFSRGEAVVGARSEDAGSWEVSFAFGTPTRPRQPDYVSDGSEWYGPPKADNPPGPGWKAIAFESFTSVPLWAVATVSAILPGWWLVMRVRRGARPEGAVVRAPRGRRLARAALATSTLMLALAVVGWIDSATWHYQSWSVGRDRFVHLTSMWGECELILMVSWLPPDESGSSYRTPWEFAHEPTLVWLRQLWLAPEYRGHHTPERLKLFEWFGLVLHTEDGDRFIDLSGGDAQTNGGGLFGAATQPTPPAPHSPVTGFTVDIPYWFVVLLMALLPGLTAIRTLRRRRRLQKDLCPGCGYDLRATPGRCPECGSGRDPA